MSSFVMPSEWTIPVEFLLLDVPEPPECPNYGMPTTPQDPHPCTNPWIEAYDVPCSDEAFRCLIFRYEHYRWRQRKLLGILNRRPDPGATARAKYDWCVEIVETVAAMADDTNIAHRFLSGYEIEDHFSRTRDTLGALRPRTSSGEDLPVMFPELWRTGRSNIALPWAAPAIGGFVLDHLGDRVDRAIGAYLWKPASHPESYMLEHVSAQHEIELPRPFPSRMGSATVGGGTARRRRAGEERSDRNRSASAIGRVREARRAGTYVTPRDLSLAIFESTPDAGQFLPGHLERATGSAPCLDSPTSRNCFHYERFRVAIAGAEVTMDVLEANARDWMNAPYEVVVADGQARYSTYLLPYAESGKLSLSAEELRAQIVTAQRRSAQAMIATGAGSAAAIASVLPGGAIVGAVITVLAAVLSALMEVLPMAHGGGDCPVMGYRRTLVDPECAAPVPQGNENIGEALIRFNRIVMPAALLDPTGQERGTDSNPSTGDDEDDEDDEDESSMLPWLGLALAGAAAVGVGVAVVRKRRRRARSRDEMEEEPS